MLAQRCAPAEGQIRPWPVSQPLPQPLPQRDCAQRPPTPTPNPPGDFSLSTHLLAGGLAGGCAAIATTPLDVCKTLLNTNEQCVGAVAAGEPTMRSGRILFGIAYAAKTVYRELGWSGFIRGWQARTLFTAPAGAISWSVYEAFKHFLVVAEDVGVADGADSVLGTDLAAAEQDEQHAAGQSDSQRHQRSALPATAR